MSSNNTFKPAPTATEKKSAETAHALGSPTIDSPAGDWASSTISSLGPDLTQTSTTITSSTVPPTSSTGSSGPTTASTVFPPAPTHQPVTASENPFATPESATGTTASTVFPPASTTTTTTTSAIDTSAIPLISPTGAAHPTNPAAHVPAFTSAAPAEVGLPGKLAVEPESFSRTTAASVPSQSTYAPSGPAMSQDTSEKQVDAGEIKVPSAAATLETAKEVATLAKDVALAAGEQVREKVIPTVAAYLPSAETTKQVAASAGETALQTGAVVGQAAVNAGSAAVEAAKPYMPTAEQTKEAAVSAGQTTANAGAAVGQTALNGAAVAGQAALGATVIAGQTAANGAVAAGQTLANGAAVAGQTVANGATVAGQTVANGAAVAGQTVKDTAVATGQTVVGGANAAAESTKNAGVAAAETTKNTGAAVADTTTNAAVNTKEGVASYIPEVHPINAVYNAAAAAGNAIRSYLPGVGSSAPIQTANTLPSQETSQNLHPATAGGVGTLPGPPGEFGVAILPDEKTHGVSTDRAVADAHVKPYASEHKPAHLGGAGILPGKAGESGVAVLPEERNKGKLPSADGGATLPGRKEEEGVAVLPDEKPQHPPLVEKVLAENPKVPTTGASTHTPVKINEEAKKNSLAHPTGVPVGAKLGGVGDLPGTPNETGVAVLPEEKSTGAKVGGVGDLPGTASESNVALLPDERNKTSTATSTSTTGVNKSNAVHPTVLTSGTVNDTTTTHRSTEPTTDGRSHPVTKAEEKVFGGHTHHELGSSDSSSPAGAAPKHKDTADLARARQANDKSTTHTPAPTHTTAAGPTTTHPTQPQAHDAATDVQKKPSLMDKVKGEAKVITGKMAHNEEKVEDGKRLMGKIRN